MNMNDSILVGLDWADKKHDICWRDIDTGETQIKVLKHRPELINEWVCNLISRYPGKRIAVCLEQTRGPVVYALMGYDAVDIYPVNPSTMSDYRKAFSPSDAKDDPGDAALMLELLERHPESLKLLDAFPCQRFAIPSRKINASAYAATQAGLPVCQHRQSDVLPFFVGRTIFSDKHLYGLEFSELERSHQ
ncbi:MAG: transposase [Kiritimatiellia bacterium]